MKRPIYDADVEIPGYIMELVDQLVAADLSDTHCDDENTLFNVLWYSITLLLW